MSVHSSHIIKLFSTSLAIFFKTNDLHTEMNLFCVSALVAILNIFAPTIRCFEAIDLQEL